MATIKQGPAPEDHYTLIPNSLSRSSTIPPRAKVVYIYLKSHRDGWDITTERVADALGMSKETVVKAIQDLVDAGYVRREKIRGDGGLYSGWEYEVLSWPVTTVGKTDHGKSPWSDKSDVGESRPHKKTNSSKKTNEEEDQPPVVPQGTAAKKPRHRITEDWTPRPEVVQQMTAECPGVDQEHELAQMRDHFLAKGTTSTDWNLNYRGWIRREAKWARERGTSRGSGGAGRKADEIIQAVVGLDQDRQEGRELAW